MKTILLSMVFSTIMLSAQPENQIIDSILNLAKGADSKELVRLYLKIGMRTRNVDIDTAFYYDNLGLELAKEINVDTLIIMSYVNIALDRKQYGDFKLAEQYLNKALYKSYEINDSSQISSIYNNLGVLKADLGKYSEALDYYFKSLKINEASNSYHSLSLNYNNIGTIHYTLGDYELAMEYYNKSLKYKRLINDEDGVALLLMNIGIIHYFKNNYDSVFINFKQAMSIWERIGNLRRLALIQSNVAEMHIELEEYDKAIAYLTSAMKTYGDLKEGLDVIHTELLIGEIYAKDNDFVNAAKMYDDALIKAINAQSISEQAKVYNAFKSLYLAKNDFKNAYAFMEKHQVLIDSMFNNEKATIIQEMETKYKTDKMQQQLVLMEKEKEVNELEKKRLRHTLYFILFGAVMLVFFTFYIIRAYRIKNEAFEMVSVKNREIVEQRNEIESQRDHANLQRDLIFKQKEAITDSINYALRIQKAMIPSDDELKSIFNEYFKFYRPKDVVSGDFYWVNCVGDRTVISLADCTGHGVPGGFMSMLGMSLLNEITKTQTNKDAAFILEQLRDYIIDSLRQNEFDNEQIDGMAMALVILTNENNYIDYAGALNPLYIISDNEVTAETSNTKIKVLSMKENNKKLYEIIPDKMPLARFLKMNKFQYNRIQVHKGDQIVMFSDGFMDQFGGKYNAKYQSKKFKQFLLCQANNAMSDQLAAIQTEFDEWKGDNEQIDDVSILSFKIS